MNSKHTVTKDGIPRYKFQYSKVTTGRYVVKPIKNQPKKPYLVDLISVVINATSDEIRKPVLPHIPHHINDKPDRSNKKTIFKVQQ